MSPTRSAEPSVTTWTLNQWAKWPARGMEVSSFGAARLAKVLHMQSCSGQLLRCVDRLSTRLGHSEERLQDVNECCAAKRFGQNRHTWGSVE